MEIEFEMKTIRETAILHFGFFLAPYISLLKCQIALAVQPQAPIYIYIYWRLGAGSALQ